MNQLATGVVLGAVPVLISSGFGLIAAVRSNRGSKELAQITLAGDHAQWLRNQRSDLYLDMNKFLRSARNHRVSVIQEMPLSDAVPLISNENRIKEVLATYDLRNPIVIDLSARGTTFCSEELGQAFDEAAKAGVTAWLSYVSAVKNAIKSKEPTSTVIWSDAIEAAMNQVNMKERRVFKMIRQDQLWTDELSELRRIGSHRRGLRIRRIANKASGVSHSSDRR